MQLPDILVVAERLGLPLHPIQGGRQLETPCWACQSRGQKPDNNKHGHLTIIPAKQTFRCPRCGYSGNVWTMARDLMGKSRGDEFIKNMCQDTVAVRTAAKRVMIEDKPSLNIKTRDTVYRELLKKLVLSPSHREDLLLRGLSEDLITENQYKTCPGKESTKGIAFLLAKEGYPLDGIPGFYKDQEGKWMFMSMPGFLVPVRDNAGCIQGFQIRVDNSYLDYVNKNTDNKLRKYIWLSSVAQTAGCSSGSPVHIANPYRKDLRKTKVGITEGLVKADIAASYTGIPFIGIAGTGLYRQACETAVTLGVRDPLIFYDADKIKNPHVIKNEAALIQELKKHHINGVACAWDDALGKGIDDLLVNLSRGEQPIEKTLLDKVIRIEKQDVDVTVTTTVTVRVSKKLQGILNKK